MFEKPNVLYTAEATATGGREGHARTSDGRVDVDLDVPAEMGGSAGPGTNPEQLFATRWAACFQSALLRFAAGMGLDLSDSACHRACGDRAGSQRRLRARGGPRPRRPSAHPRRGRRPDEPRTRGLSLLKGDPRQYRGHADRRRDDHRATGGVMSGGAAVEW